DDTVTRGQFVTFLWRAAGKPAGSGRNPFVDLRSNGFYVDAVGWAVSQAITAGVDATHFQPETPCNRAQVVTFLFRCFGN
ncbi:MAG: S-layer homology domain-containing protein, partial [Clostridiales bacterium]|nr:S-layer homology domain-containing protein [Clostridiales bacterium]